MDKICENLDENDLTNVVLEYDDPIDLCNSKTDALITIENIPEIYALKFELDDVDHSGATFICSDKVFGINAIEKIPLRPTKSPDDPKATKALKDNNPNKTKDQKKNQTKST